MASVHTWPYRAGRYLMESWRRLPYEEYVQIRDSRPHMGQQPGRIPDRGFARAGSWWLRIPPCMLDRDGLSRSDGLDTLNLNVVTVWRSVNHRTWRRWSTLRGLRGAPFCLFLERGMFNSVGGSYLSCGYNTSRIPGPGASAHDAKKASAKWLASVSLCPHPRYHPWCAASRGLKINITTGGSGPPAVPPFLS